MRRLGRFGGPRHDGVASFLAARSPAPRSSLCSRPIFPRSNLCRLPTGLDAFHLPQIPARAASLACPASSRPSSFTACAFPSRSLSSSAARSTPPQGLQLHASQVFLRSRRARASPCTSVFTETETLRFNEEGPRRSAQTSSSVFCSHPRASSHGLSYLSCLPVCWTHGLARASPALTRAHSSQNFVFNCSSLVSSSSRVVSRRSVSGLSLQSADSASFSSASSRLPVFGTQTRKPRFLFHAIRAESSGQGSAMQSSCGSRVFISSYARDSASPRPWKCEIRATFSERAGLQCMYTSTTGSKALNDRQARSSLSPQSPSSDNATAVKSSEPLERMPASGRVPSMSEPVVHTPQTVRPAVVVAERTLAPDAVSQPTFPSPAAASSPPSVQAKESASPSAPSGSRAPPATSVRLSPLHEVHAGLGAKFGKFQGVLLPFAYEGEGVMSSHLHTRTCASLFDFSYRQHYRIWGEKAAQLLERLVVGDVQSLLETESRFTLFTNDDGGILDDVIVAVHPGFLLVMGNACNKAKVLERLEAEAAIARGRGERVTVEALDDFTLLGVQGAQAMEVMGQVVDAASVDLVKMPFMSSYLCTVEGVECVLTRCGFSGEDGFEISLLSEEASMVFSALLEKSSLLRPAGFGTRETLRQEAGLCLYGADIDEETTPVEASLGWAVGRRRRQEANFPGASRILAQLVQLQLLQSQAKSRVHIDAETLQAQLDEAAEKAGIFEVDRLRRKRVGLALPAGGSTTKGGVAVLSLEGEKKVGAVTSSCFAPSLQRTIGMAYLDLPYTLPKTRVQLDTPRPTKDVEVCKMPFVPGAYYRVPLPL